MWVLSTKPRSSARVVHSLNHLASFYFWRHIFNWVRAYQVSWPWKVWGSPISLSQHCDGSTHTHTFLGEPWKSNSGCLHGELSCLPSPLLQEDK